MVPLHDTTTEPQTKSCMQLEEITNLYEISMNKGSVIMGITVYSLIIILRFVSTTTSKPQNIIMHVHLKSKNQSKGNHTAVQLCRQQNLPIASMQLESIARSQIEGGVRRKNKHDGAMWWSIHLPRSRRSCVLQQLRQLPWNLHLMPRVGLPL